MPDQPSMDAALMGRIDALCEEGSTIWHDFDLEVRQNEWHPFVAADYESVRTVLLSLRRPGARFLEWGSATGVITIMADMMGFESCGIELDGLLVEVARELATRSGSKARFAAGSFIPMGWEWRPSSGDKRVGTIGEGRSGYTELGSSLSDFDVVYGFPWPGEDALMLDLMRAHGQRGAHLVVHTPNHGTQVYKDGRLQS